MTLEIFHWVVLAHVIVGSTALMSFWIPVFAKKGSGLHITAGRIFVYAMFATAITAAIAATMTMIAPLTTHPDRPESALLSLRLINGLMLAYLASITFVSAFSGLRAVQLKRRYGGHREAIELGVNAIAFVMSVLVLGFGIAYESVLLMGISVLGLTGIPGNIRLILWRPAEGSRAWLLQHLASMLGAGVAAHTAFLVFGMSNIAPELTGNILVWLAPAIIGIPAISIWKRRYRQGSALPKQSVEATP